MNRLLGHYQGPVELVVEDVSLGAITVSLRAYVDVHEVRTLGGTSNVDGLRSWEGDILDADGVNLWSAIGQMVVLRTPTGRQGEVIVQSSTQLLGSGEPPFNL